MRAKNGNSLILLLIAVSIVILTVCGYFTYRQLQKRQSEKLKSDVINMVKKFHPAAQLAEQQEKTVQPTTEPVVNSWKTYTNTTYKFKIEVPENWYEMDYPGPKVFDGTISIDFSPTQLPDKNTYPAFPPYYFSVNIFPTSHVIEYENYLKQLAKIGTDADNNTEHVKHSW
jgi:hypothetical protein